MAEHAFHESHAPVPFKPARLGRRAAIFKKE